MSKHETNGYRFEVLVDVPEKFNWVLMTPWGKIVYDCGYIESPKEMSDSVALYMLENEVKSYRYYIKTRA